MTAIDRLLDRILKGIASFEQRHGVRPSSVWLSGPDFNAVMALHRYEIKLFSQPRLLAGCELKQDDRLDGELRISGVVSENIQTVEVTR